MDLRNLLRDDEHMMVEGRRHSRGVEIKERWVKGV